MFRFLRGPLRCAWHLTAVRYACVKHHDYRYFINGILSYWSIGDRYNDITNIWLEIYIIPESLHVVPHNRSANDPWHPYQFEAYLHHVLIALHVSFPANNLL